MTFVAILASVAVALGAGPAFAYVGPGAGLSLLGAFWGLLIAVLAALAVVVLYPVRRLLRARKRPAEAAAGDGPAPQG